MKKKMNNNKNYWEMNHIHSRWRISGDYEIKENFDTQELTTAGK